ncbi:MAG: hypothetical protein CMM44_11970 [Rhodospirillaceae bacterium]|nr:hypothetical protein [Rhodospirillaceae bacterium]
MNRLKLILNMMLNKQDFFLFELTRLLIIFIFKLIIIGIIIYSLLSFSKNLIKEKIILDTNALIKVMNFSENKLSNLDNEQRAKIRESLDKLLFEICEINNKFYFCIKDDSK